MDTNPTHTARKRPRRRRRVLYAAFALAAMPAAVMAYEALTVTLPNMPAVGETDAGACDTDGVTTTYTYGATSKNGVKVETAKVTGISTDCTIGTLTFMNGTTAVASYNGTVTAGALNYVTNVWTNEFTSVRVALYP